MAYSFTNVASTMINLELGTTFSNISLAALGISQALSWNYTSDNGSWWSYWTAGFPSVAYSTSYLNLCDPGNLVRTMNQTILSQMGSNSSDQVTTACLDFDPTVKVVYYGDVTSSELVAMNISNPSTPSYTFSSVTYPPCAVTTGFTVNEVVFLQSDTGSSTYTLRVSDLSTYNNLLYTISTSPPAIMPNSAYRNRILDTLIFETAPNTFESLVCYLDRSGDNFFIIDSSGTALWDYTSITAKSLPYLKFKISPERSPGNLGNRQIYLYYQKSGSVTNDVFIIDVSYSSGFGFSYIDENIGSTGFINDLDFVNQYGSGGSNDYVYFIDANYDVSVYNWSTSAINNSISSFPPAWITAYASPNKIITAGDDSDRYMVFEGNGKNNSWLCFYNCWGSNPVGGWKSPNQWFTASYTNTIFLEAAVRMDDKHLLFGGDATNQDIAMLNTSAMFESNVANRITNVLSSAGHSWDFIKVRTDTGTGLTAAYLYHYYGGSGSPVGTGIIIWF